MKNFSVKQIRRRVLEYFISHGYQKRMPAPLVHERFPKTFNPSAGDVELFYLLKNGPPKGKVSFVVLGHCIRSVDIEKVGYDVYLSLFDMNTAFHVINESTNSHKVFLEQEKVFREIYEFFTYTCSLSPHKLLVTVFEGGEVGGEKVPFDKEAAETWKRISSNKINILPLGTQENFLFPKEDGELAGVRYEIYYNLEGITEHPKWVELGTVETLGYKVKYERGKYYLVPINFSVIGTAVGIERLAMVLQKVHTIYDIDEIREVKEIINMFIDNKLKEALFSTQLNIIADHIRPIVLAMEDGQLPDNTSRGKILKKLIRRLIRASNSLGIYREDLYKALIDKVYAVYGLPYDAHKVENILNEILKRREN